MKKWLSFVLMLSLITSISSWAKSNIVVHKSADMALFRQVGVGGSYPQQMPDGSFRMAEITGFRNGQNGTLVVDIEFDKTGAAIYFHNDDSVEVSSGLSSSLNVNLGKNSAEKSETSNDENDFSVGIGAGAMAALSAYLKNSSAARAIRQSSARIEKMRLEMQEDLKTIEKIRINLKTNVMTVFEGDRSASAPISHINDKSTDSQIAFLRESHIEREALPWRSEDQHFVERAESIRQNLNLKRPRTSVQKGYHAIAKASLSQADEASAASENEEAMALLDMAEIALDALVGIDPFTGVARNLYESITGLNLITGQQLSYGDRMLATLGVLTGGAIPGMKIYRHLLPIIEKVAPTTIEAFQKVHHFLTETGQNFELVEKGSIVRRIHLKSVAYPKWGLRPKHLRKHFFGEGPLALKNIDPAGTTDHWMTNIADLAQRNAATIYPDGITDIYHYYQKADHTGFYRLGIRLAPRHDGTFDLVTILTDQMKAIK